MWKTVTGAALAALISGAAAAAGHLLGSAECQPAGPPAAYNCRVHLRYAVDGRPVEGAKVVVNADMPSMPMAHHVRPAVARAAPDPGWYLVRLHLDMPGAWVLLARVSGPTADVVRILVELP